MSQQLHPNWGTAIVLSAVIGAFCFVSDADRVPESYTRYLERALRKIFGITHAPMRLHLRSSHKKKSEK